VDVRQTPQLTWNIGQDSVQHDVYFAADANAVAAADTTTADVYQGRQAETTSEPAKLEWNTTYYWRIDEVNDLNPDSPWKGAVWSFTTADFMIIDDFESYDAYDDQIWWTWRDGLGYVAHDDEPAFGGNGTGSAVGDESAFSYTEEGNPHGGAQAIPFFYDNNKQGVAKYSEAERTLTNDRDWTQKGVVELSLWFHGDPANSAERLYVAVSNAAGQPVVVANVDKIVLGVGTRGNMTVPGGAGKMLFDDIRLAR